MQIVLWWVFIKAERKNEYKIAKFEISREISHPEIPKGKPYLPRLTINVSRQKLVKYRRSASMHFFFL